MGTSSSSGRIGSIIIFICILVFVFLLTILSVSTRVRSSSFDPGVTCVKALYNFEAPADILTNQQFLKSILTEEEFERLKIDDTNRAINAYYKFQYSSSRVVVEDFGRGYVRYRLENDYIDPDTVWVFLYELTSEGKITNVREYSSLDWKESSANASN